MKRRSGSLDGPSGDAQASGVPVEARLTEAELRDLTDALPHLMWTCLATGPCDYLSRQWVEYTGIPETEQLGYAWLAQLHPDDRERVQHEWAAAVGLGQPFDIEFRIRRADGVHKWFRTRAVPLRDPAGAVVKWYGSNTDIDDYKRANDEVARLNHELEQLIQARTAELTMANHELEAFSYSVAHDLRAPLRGMSGFAGIVLDEHGDTLDTRASDHLRRIRDEAELMGRLIDALLGLARVTRAPLRIEAVDLSALARSIVSDLARGEPERDTEFRVERGLAAELDPVLARTLLQNLIGNSWKFTAGADPATIEVGSTEIEGARAFFVRDNGAGFDMAHAHGLFAPFHRLHTTREFPGTGMGLATAHRIVSRHGGRLWGEGRVGAGATFYFVLESRSDR